MILYHRNIEKYLRAKVQCHQFLLSSFMFGISTTETLLMLRQILEKPQEKQIMTFHLKEIMHIIEHTASKKFFV